MKQVLVVSLAVVCLLLPGCGGAEADAERSARERLAAFAEALRSGDREAFADCYAIDNDTERALVDATFALARSMLRLHEAVAARHEGPIVLFQGDGGGAGPPLPTTADWAARSRLSFDPGAGEASASVPGSERPMRLALRDGRWLVRLAPIGADRPTRQWLEDRAELMRRIAAAVDAARTELAERGAAPAEVRRALGERIARLIRGALTG